MGFTTKVSSGKDKRGRERMHTVCGLLIHSSLVATTDGLPLGIAAAKFWTRKKFKGTNALRRRINPTRVPIEGKECLSASGFKADRRVKSLICLKQRGHY